MHERISLNGAPVVGFGDQGTDYQAMWAHQKATIPGTIVGFFVGAIGGAFLGNTIHKGAVGAAAGIMAGGVGGAVGGNLLASYALRKPPLKSCEDLSPAEQKIAFDKAKANLEAAGTPFDGSVWSDPVKFSAFMAEVYKTAGCQPPTTPPRTIGFGQAELVAPVVATSPWKVAIVTSVVGAAAGWAIEEAAKKVRGKKRR